MPDVTISPLSPVVDEKVFNISPSNESIPCWEHFMLFEKNLKGAVDEFQRQLIRQRLRQFEGNRAAVARSLQMDRENFHRLLKRLDLQVN